MRQHDQRELELHWHRDSGTLSIGIIHRRKEHGDNRGPGESQHVHGPEEVPCPLYQSEKETQRTERLRYVVLVEIGIAKKSSGGVMVVKQPCQQWQNWNACNRHSLNAASTVAI